MQDSVTLEEMKAKAQRILEMEKKKKIIKQDPIKVAVYCVQHSVAKG